MRNIPNDVKLQSNKSILSLFSPNLRHLLSTSSTVLLPECSTSSIKYLLNIVNHGFAVTDRISNKDIKEVTETALLLSLDLGELYHDKTVPCFVETNQGATSSKRKRSSASEKSNDENPESIIDVMDSLIRIFDPDYKDEEDFNIVQNFCSLNEAKWSEPQQNVRGAKRKRNDILRNDNGK